MISYIKYIQTHHKSSLLHIISSNTHTHPPFFTGGAPTKPAVGVGCQRRLAVVHGSSAATTAAVMEEPMVMVYGGSKHRREREREN
ncbi:hypothetical protein HanOQP8_Chr09g0313991 [Helianthus annuus]|nr:hypothetical protein HanHA89_Chr09g0328711 [Helianthus annuus]KAJ0706538.1 hypothetical protein HanLR1_Chr09g0308161 [Helianthus annuus]KAJ0710576.1 hypothetical protein HanOQP8_Chr09g0313991 [Helianthus annuus]